MAGSQCMRPSGRVKETGRTAPEKRAGAGERPHISWHSSKTLRTVAEGLSIINKAAPSTRSEPCKARC